jgi:hypothetical protein
MPGVLVRPVSEPHWGRTVWVDTIEDGFGGNGANTSYTLARLALRWCGMLKNPGGLRITSFRIQ